MSESTAERVARKRHERSLTYRLASAWSEIDAVMEQYFPDDWEIVKRVTQGIAVAVTMLLLMGCVGGIE